MSGKHRNKTAGHLLILAVLLILSGCAGSAKQSGEVAPNDSSVDSFADPFERVNRSVLKFNQQTDRILLKPVARVYSEYIPSPVRTGVSNFFSNLWQPMTIVNDVLQGKFVYAAKDTSRFVINSTIGLFGVFDVATHMNLPKRKEDFGQTLAVWGAPSGPYLVLPLLGPSTIRDTAGLAPQMIYADTLSYANSPTAEYASAVRLIDTRSSFLGADEVLEVQPDQYLFLREAYRQQRLSQIHDGDVAADSVQDSDALIDQLLEN